MSVNLIVVPIVVSANSLTMKSLCQHHKGSLKRLDGWLKGLLEGSDFRHNPYCQEVLVSVTLTSGILASTTLPGANHSLRFIVKRYLQYYLKILITFFLYSIST